MTARKLDDAGGGPLRRGVAVPDGAVDGAAEGAADDKPDAGADGVAESASDIAGDDGAESKGVPVPESAGVASTKDFFEAISTRSEGCSDGDAEETGARAPGAREKTNPHFSRARADGRRAPRASSSKFGARC